MPERVVLDSSALLAYWQDEPGAADVERWLAGGDVWMNLVNLGEVTYVIERAIGAVVADQFFLDALDEGGFGDQPPLHWAPLDARLVREAARLKARGGVSLADAFAAATARVLEAEVAVTRDDEEFQVAAERGIKVYWIG
jgi:PIN domain nuclease of toxin-antitoxin system